MPRTELVLSVFLASPSDLVEERSRFSEVIAELNSLWATKLGVRLAVWKWETHAYPAFGGDAQAVINEQMPDDFDLFVGMMWARFGSPTPRAGSGTAEEFERALARFKESPNSSQLMIYFKDAPKPISEIDPAQLGAVNTFRSRVEAEGGLHWSFSSADDFAVNLRIHLTRFVQDWQQRNMAPMPVSVVAETSAPASMTSEIDEAGYFDVLEDATAGMIEIGEILERLNASTLELKTSTEQRTAELEALNDAAGTSSPAAYKRVVNRLASDLNRYSSATRREIGTLEQRLDEVLRGTGQLASFSLDFNSDSSAMNALTTLADQVDGFGAILSESADSVRQMRGSVASSPRMTTEYNRAKRAAIDVQDEVVRVLVDASQTCIRVVAGIRAIVTGRDERGSGAAS